MHHIPVTGALGQPLVQLFLKSASQAVCPPCRRLQVVERVPKAAEALGVSTGNPPFTCNAQTAFMLATTTPLCVFLWQSS